MAFEEQQPFDPASFEHIPVLLSECLTGLAIDPAGTYLDLSLIHIWLPLMSRTFMLYTLLY